ncbi:MAG: hypothetical protein U0470_07910 [Anaerolineae bacterium]
MRLTPRPALGDVEMHAAHTYPSRSAIAQTVSLHSPVLASPATRVERSVYSVHVPSNESQR